MDSPDQPKPAKPVKQGTFSRLLIKKDVAALVEEGEKRGGLKRTLGPVSLTLLGLGAIIGTGIFVLTGVAARDYAGPSIVISFVIAGTVAAMAALAYAELASMIPVAGSAYTYAYAGIGELLAWIIAWDLILEYAVGSMTVAIGWSGYVGGLVRDLGFEIPPELLAGPLEGGVMNVVATGIVLLITMLLIKGIQESANVTNMLVVVKVGIILFIIIFGLSLVSATNYSPFFHHERGLVGTFTAAGLVFFSYIGFDALSTTAEEAKNPQRDLPIGILASLGISTALYVLAALVITGMIPYSSIDLTEPFAHAFRIAGYSWGGNLIAASAGAGITSVLIVLLLAQPRIFFSMARDRLLPAFIAKVHPKYRTPYIATLITGVVVAVVAGFVPIGIVATVTNIGTLFAFGLVSASVIILRYSNPNAKRGYRVPGPPWLLPGIGALGALTLMLFLPLLTWLVFLAWFGIGLVIYASYGYYKSRALAEAIASPQPST